jgi:ankyrin repeat protein
MRCSAAMLIGLAAMPGQASDLFDAIRNNKCAAVRRLAATREAANSQNATGATALMYAALHADVRCMKHLLDRGADANATNDAGATALIWAANDIDKVRLLLARGADVKARTKEGRTAIHVAARRDGASEVVRLLLDNGADVNDSDAAGGTPLLLAADGGDVDTVKLLIARGADVHHRPSPNFGAPRFAQQRPPGFVTAKPTGDFGGMSALMIAASHGHAEIVRLLLAKGASVRHTSVGNTTALHDAVMSKSIETVRLLLDAGAEVNSANYTRATPLIIAGSLDDVPAGTVKLLLERGADLGMKDEQGRTARDWALLRGTAEIARTFGGTARESHPGAGQVTYDPAAARQAVEKSLPLLLASSRTFFKQSGCISCHHQSLAQMAVASARRHGFRIYEEEAGYQNKAAISVFRPHRETLLQAIPTVPVTPIVSSYALLGLAAEAQPADDTTDAMVHELAARQRRDGSWRTESGRPPLGQGDITATALTLRALQVYAPPGRRREFEERVANARAWLASARAVTHQEKTMRLLGLVWGGANDRVIRSAATDLAGDQREDGGWAQLRGLDSDAYATGQALYALTTARAITPSALAYRRGAAFSGCGTEVRRLVAHQEPRVGLPAVFRERISTRTRPVDLGGGNGVGHAGADGRAVAATADCRF